MHNKYYKYKSSDFNLSNTIVLFLSLILVFFGFQLTTMFLSFNESRMGYLMFDPVLELLPSVELSGPLFMITYMSIVMGLILSFTSVRDTIIAIQAICCLLILRIICMSLVPLEPPVGIIPLQDDFLSHTFYDNQVLLKDLFFSGHTASIALLAYLIQHKTWSKVYFILSVIVGSMLILQHVHYTLDVVCAYMFSYLAYRLGIYLGDQSLVMGRFTIFRLVKSGFIKS